MKREPTSHRPGRRPRQRFWLAIWAVVLPLVIVIRIASSQHSAPVENAEVFTTGAQPRASTRPTLTPPTASAAPSMSTPPGAAASNLGMVNERTMLSALKNWIKRRDGMDVEVVQSLRICDLDGRPVSLSVIVSGLPETLTARELRDRLDRLAVSERSLREQLQAAHQRGDAEIVNRLAAEHAASRSAFIRTNQLSSYRLGLSVEEPPVLAFWKGLTYETARESEARALARRTLGDSASLDTLIGFTSVAPLLAFTNRAGAAVYIDPVRLTEVPRSVIGRVSLAARVAPRDVGREARVADQWRDMLNVDSPIPD